MDVRFIYTSTTEEAGRFVLSIIKFRPFQSVDIIILNKRPFVTQSLCLKREKTNFGYQEVMSEWKIIQRIMSPGIYYVTLQ